MTGLSTDTVQEKLEAAVANHVIPGAAVAVTDANGATRLATAGNLRIDGGAAVGENTMFALMSMTKALATVGALQLVEQGKLDLDQEVASVLPVFGELKVLEGFDGDTPRLREPSRQATIRMLMNHTAGHGYNFLNADLMRYEEVTGAPSLFSGAKAALEMPLIADPGTAWNYGINCDWLGQVLEAVSGQDLASYLREHVFEPLGMVDATFSPSDEQKSRRMAVHDRTEDGGLKVSDIQGPPDHPEFWPAGHGAYGTAVDYSRFMAALLGGGELDGARILQPETVELAFSDHLGGVALPQLIKTTAPALSNDIPSLPFAQGWGLGFHLFLEDVPAMRHASSGDWAGLFNCYYWIDRDTGIAATMLTQVLPFFDLGIVGLLAEVEQATYAALTPSAG